MTPDQICHRLCNRDVLKIKGGRRVASASAMEVTLVSGAVKGRSADGKPIEGKVRVGGKSLARRLMEAEQAKKESERKAAAEEQTGSSRDRRRKRRGEMK